MADFNNIASHLRRESNAPAEGHNRSYVLNNGADLVVSTTKRGDLLRVDFFVRRRGEKRQLTGWWASWGNGQGTNSNSKAAYEKVAAKVIADITSGRADSLINK